jgi:hypothetical protein
MKHKATDMKEILTTGEDRVAKVNELKKIFADHKDKMTFRVTRRKLASGVKFYFHLEVVGEWREDETFSWKQGLRGFALPIIQERFPEANLTSGGTLSMTIAAHH